MKSLHLTGLLALAVVSLHGQTSPVYWSATKPDCSSLMNGETPIQITSGNTVLGYSCYVSGTFVWLAAGGMWGTTLRVSAPALNDIDADFTFYDTSGGNNVSLDSTLNNDNTTLASGNEVEVSLFANQPLEVEVLGNTSDAPNYGSTAEGSVYATFYCPDAATCANVLPQLLYSALPSQPWSLSVPIAWDDQLSSQWSAVAIDDPSISNTVGFVIYNEDNASANTYTIYVYDANGNPPVSGTTPSVPPSQSATGEGGTYADLLENVVSNIPTGPIKILIDGGSLLSAVEVLQINGTSATTLQVAFDTAPGAASAAMKRPRSSVRRLHMPSSRKVAPRSFRK